MADQPHSDDFLSKALQQFRDLETVPRGVHNPSYAEWFKLARVVAYILDHLRHTRRNGDPYKGT
jgi:hypothetical protein